MEAKAPTARAFDGDDNLTDVVEPDAAKSSKADVHYTYDELNRQVTETSGGLTHEYKYDLAGNRVWVKYGGASPLTLVSAYDAQNRLSTLTEGTSETSCVYDANDNIKFKYLPSGDKIASDYDAANRTTSLIGTTGTNAPLYAYAYEYDAGANVRKVTESYANSSLTRTASLAEKLGITYPSRS